MKTLDQFIIDWTNKGIDTDGAFGFQFDNGYQLRDNKGVKVYTIFSKTHGKFDILLDDKDYDLISSMGKWNISVNRGKPYAEKRLKGSKLVQMHRFLMNTPKGKYTDHIDQNTLNNQRNNLRITTNAANLRNGKVRPNNTSGYTGISKRKDYPNNPYVAKIRVNYKYLYLGSYPTFELAVEARKQAERRYFDS